MQVIFNQWHSNSAAAGDSGDNGDGHDGDRVVVDDDKDGVGDGDDGSG